jgi:hypothetical protein
MKKPQLTNKKGTMKIQEIKKHIEKIVYLVKINIIEMHCKLIKDEIDNKEYLFING